MTLVGGAAGSMGTREPANLRDVRALGQDAAAHPTPEGYGRNHHRSLILLDSSPPVPRRAHLSPGQTLQAEAKPLTPRTNNEREEKSAKTCLKFFDVSRWATDLGPGGALLSWRQSVEPSAMRRNPRAERARAITKSLVLPQILNSDRTCQPKFIEGHTDLFTHRTPRTSRVRVEKGQVSVSGIRNARDPGNGSSSIEQLPVARAVLIDRQNLPVGQKRQREFVIARQIPAEHQG
jgi:hypothetical protein